MTLSTKFECAIIKLCKDIEENPIKTIKFENYFLQNIIHSFCSESYNAIQ